MTEKKSKFDNQKWVWDVRWSKEQFENEDEVIASFDGVAKKYCFQLERGASGYEHWQGRISLIKKKRYKHEVLPLFEEDKKPYYCEPTTNKEHDKEAFYCMKKDSRIDGPWCDTDLPKPVLTKQMVLFKQWGLLPWQQKLINELSEFDLRKIDLIYDPTGCAGKSLFSEYMELQGLAEDVPCYRLMDDIFQWVYCMPTKPVYIMDMPRGMKKDKLGDLYSGIEVIKNGVAYDKRHRAKKKRFDRPRVAVFTNELPNLDLMSADRWVLWTIKDDELITYNPLAKPSDDLDF